MNETIVRVDAETIRPGDRFVDRSGEWVVAAVGEPVYDNDDESWLIPVVGKEEPASIVDYHDAQVIRSDGHTSG